MSSPMRFALYGPDGGHVETVGIEHFADARYARVRSDIAALAVGEGFAMQGSGDRPGRIERIADMAPCAHCGQEIDVVEGFAEINATGETVCASCADAYSARADREIANPRPSGACPDCGQPITLQGSGWWTHDGHPFNDNGDPTCWQSSMDGPDIDPAPEQGENYCDAPIGDPCELDSGADCLRHGSAADRPRWAYLLKDGNLGVPGGRYGSDTESCAPIAIALADIIADATGEDDTDDFDTLDHCMSMVVNSSDEVVSLIADHGSATQQALIADAIGEHFAECDAAEIREMMSGAESGTVLVDGTQYSPSWRALDGGHAVYRLDSATAVAAYEETLDRATDDIGAYWEDGSLWAPSDDTSDDDARDHDFDVCPDCGNAGVKIGADGYEPCTRFRTCTVDDPTMAPHDDCALCESGVADAHRAEPIAERSDTWSLRRDRAAANAYRSLLDMGANLIWRGRWNTGTIHGPRLPTGALDSTCNGIVWEGDDISAGVIADRSQRATVDEILRGYIECALWSTNADHLDPEGTGAAGALQEHFSPSDIAPEALASMRADCADFYRANVADLDEYAERMDRRPQWTGYEMSGHDLWLTRNGHGVGFWDRDLGALGDRLSDMARPMGESYIYAGDDGKLYV
jgi:hypothetical protein